MNKQLFTAAATIILSASILGACSNNEVANETEPTATSAATMPVVEATATDPQTSERPETREFGEQEGGVSGQTATLEQGDGYSLYITGDFTLNAQTNRLSLTEDPTYYAEIESLASEYDLTALQQQGETELSATGNAEDYSGELVEHPLGFAELYLQATGDKGIVDYMVWKNQAGEAFLFRIHNPKGALSNKFSPWVMVSLATLERN